jgi:imidazolonepropionase-like amidohydrolase
MSRTIRMSHRLITVAVSVAAVTLGLIAAQAPQSGGVTVFEGARLIIGDGSAPIESSAFVVQGDRFTEVGRRGQVKIPAGARRVDVTGKTVIPAIVDAHTHMPSERPALVETLEHKAYWGVGALISLGTDAGDIALQVRQQPLAGAPLLRTAGRGITSPEPGRTTVPYWVTSEGEARKAVQELASRKVDIVKIWVDDRDGKYTKLTPALYGAVIDEAHKNKLRVTAHIVTLDDAKGLVRARLDGFAHSVRDRDVDDEIVGMIKKRPDFFLIPNLPDRGVKTDLSWLDTVPAGELKKLQEGSSTDRPALQQAFGIQARNLARLNKEGVLVALGTDGGVPWSHHLEMADMAAAGMTPMQVIVAATRNAAQVLRLADLGTIAPGKSAAFVVLDANPLDDITNTRRISAVYLRGTAIDRTALKARFSGGKS